MTVRVLVVLAVLALTALLGLWWRARDGRFTAVDPTVLAAAHITAAEAEEHATATTRTHEQIAPGELGAALGARATFVQFSSEVCSPCRRTHQVLTELVAEHDDVAHVDLDVTEHLDLVRRFGVMRTPTTLVLDGHGAVVGRMSGASDRRHALAALDAVAPVPAAPAGSAAPAASPASAASADGCPDACPGGATAR
ncbi:thioredoxin family protein [Cellulomonas soli]